jgi:hypothetical protein
VRLVVLLLKFAAALVLWSCIAFLVGVEYAACGTGITVPSTVTDTARCILDVMSKDLLSGMTLAAATDDAAIRCLGGLTPATRDQVQTVWGAHRAAEMREMHDRDGGAE